MKKQILSILLCCVMLVGLLPTAVLAAGPDVWDGSTKAPSGSGTSKSDPYLISTGKELAWLATLAAEGNYYVKLTNDIILNDGTFDQNGNLSTSATPKEWTPAKKAVWHIDGDGHYISGLYINSDRADYVGLFSNLRGDSYVKNLTIKNSYVRLTCDKPQNGNGYAGIFAGKSYKTDFTNCFSENNILSTSCYVTAGIVGDSSNCSFNGVHTSGSVNGSGIIGGIAGYDNDGTFKNCWNEAKISNEIESIRQSGGIAGLASNSNFYNCANLGSLHGGSRVGGIVGEAKNVTIKNCYGLKSIQEYKIDGKGFGTYPIGTLVGTGASVSLSYAEDGFERNDNGETGVVPHFTGKGKLTESGDENDLLNALNDNLYEMDGEEGLNEWSRTNDGYPLPNGPTFVNTAKYYNIWLDGVRVSERNQNDILKNGLASYNNVTNTLSLHDGLVVTKAYNNSLLYTEGDINLCVDGSVEFRSAQNVGGSPIVINLGEATAGGNLRIYAPEGKSAAVTVTGAYSEYGIDVQSLTLGGDVCLTVRTTARQCFAACSTITLQSSEAVLDAENLSGNHSMLNFVSSVNLPTTNPQKLYEGTGTDLKCVTEFTKTRQTESGTTEPYMYPHIRIAPEVYALSDTLPKSLTVSMTEANTEVALSTWATGEIRKGDITASNSEITVSDVVPAVAGSNANESGTDGSFTVTVKLTKNGISKTTTIPGTITATAYTAPSHTHCICGGDTAVGDHTTHTDVTYQPWDGTSAIDYGDDNTAYVCLTDNVTIQSNLEIEAGKTLYLCLNGKTFASSGTTKIEMRENSHFILCDCAGGGTIDGADSCWGGAGIYLHNSTMDMYGGKITGGHTGNGGGGAIALDDVNCVFNMYGGEISGNKADRYAGAIFLNGTLQSNKGGTVNLYGGTIKNNSAQLGGAIYAVYGGTVNLFGGEISGNKATVNGGGAICLNHSGVLNMTGGTIAGNEAKTDGGAVNLYASTFTFSDGTISNNYSAEYGGAVYLSISGKLNMTGGEICNNTAAEEGGAVHVYGENATFNFSGGTITGNEAKKDGGAVYLNQENSTLNMTGGEISGNKATRNGGAVYMFRETSTLNLSGGTIKNNTAGSSGGAVYFNTTSDGKIQGILNISGNPVVKDNTVSSKANNIAMKTGKTLSIVDTMTDGATVGITTESTDYPVVFSNAYDTDYAGYFFADDENAHVNYNSEKKLELAAGAPHTHSWATAWSKNDTHHWHECTADGCDVTNDADKNGYAEHTYDQQVATADYKASDATCTAKATYYKSCICGAKGMETFESGEVDASNHTFGAWIDEVSATCKTTGTKGHKDCSGCNKHFDADGNEITDLIIPFDPANHEGTPGDWVKTDPDKHWKEYSCCSATVEEGTHVYDDDTDTDCNTCGYIRTITPSHTHSWAEDWSNNETHHWHECTADGCDVTNNADKNGYATHTYDQEIATADYKASDATCTAKATYYKSCVCGAKGTETFESGEVNTSNHTFGAWINEVPATCKTTGTKGHKDCTSCGKHFGASNNEITDLTIPVDPANHEGTLGDWVKTDPDKHWKEYSCCSAKVEEGTHVYDDDTDTTCNTCGYTRTITPVHTHSWSEDWSKNDTHHWHECAADGCDVTNDADKDGYAEHTYDQKIATADYKASDATCTAKASYYKSCICGAKGTETFESGELAAHTFGAWINEVAATCQTTGTEGHKDCTSCGKHFDASNNEITDLTIPVDPNNHEGTPGDWQTDPDTHWKVYSCCGAKVEEGVHTASDWITDTAATATTDGTKHKECTVCHRVLETGTIPATGYTVTFDANGGSVTPESAKTNAEGKLTSLPTPTRSGSYSFDGWYTAASGGNKITTDYVFSADTTVHAHWRYTGSTGSSSGVSTYTIKVEKTDNGDVTSSHKSAAKGTTVTLTVVPDKGYTLETITVTDGSGNKVKLTEKNGKYTFTMPASNVTVKATFMEDNSMLNFFVDVFPGDYCYDAVLWAAENGITGGVDAAHFAPNAPCTRAQAVTFLWRAAGCPAPKTSTMPFTDVKAGSYYYDAVLWAVENGITKGTSDTTFSPDVTCSRAQIVTFLWRAQSTPTAGTGNPFKDVAADAYYADAVLWAVKEAITKGTSDTTFSPDDICTRAQIVTFLYRCLGGE